MPGRDGADARRGHSPHLEAAGSTTPSPRIADFVRADTVAAEHAGHACRIDFQTDPSRYRHWKLRCDGPVAHLIMDVDPAGGLFDGYELKLNSYDLGVDIELADAVQRLRFEHPEVRVRRAALRQGRRVLRRRQYPHARRRQPRPQGQFLQVHQRNAAWRSRTPRENSGQTYLAAISGAAPAAATSWR